MAFVGHPVKPKLPAETHLYTQGSILTEKHKNKVG